MSTRGRIETGCSVLALGLTAFVLVATVGRAALPDGRSLDIERQGAGINLHWLGITGDRASGRKGSGRQGQTETHSCPKQHSVS